jgi:hypothetical protein
LLGSNRKATSARRSETVASATATRFHTVAQGRHELVEGRTLGQNQIHCLRRRRYTTNRGHHGWIDLDAQHQQDWTEIAALAPEKLPAFRPEAEPRLRACHRYELAQSTAIEETGVDMTPPYVVEKEPLLLEQPVFWVADGAVLANLTPDMILILGLTRMP